MKSVIIAAPMSGSGKTTITLGLMECLKRRGVKVAPFKVGPDFIDPGYHKLVTGRPSINLDGWMCGPQTVRETFARHTKNMDFAVIEGVMGLFDGISGRSDEGSTAQIARLTGAPVVLVLDARGLARSAAAIVKGFAEFDPDVRVSGVIFNNVASDNHARLLRDAVETVLPAVRVLGCIPRTDQLAIPSRHLGLMTVEENPLEQEFLDHLVEVTRTYVDLGMFWSVATPTDLAVSQALSVPERKTAGEPVRIGVASDRAFCFTYETNLQLLEEAGAELCFFSPLTDNDLPEGVNGLYLPGGYPELFADTLAANHRLKRAIRDVIEAEMPVYAECGGFIYLTRGVEEASAEGGPYLRPLSPGDGGAEGGVRAHAFVGIFPATTRMLPRRKALGYREVKLRADTIIGRKGTVARGHEFHYSEMGAMPAEVERLYRVRRGQNDLGVEGYRYKNCLASYIHLHFGSNPAIAESFVESCRKFKR
ncbi:cobyrinate a,c-diamide synthase [Geobacter argillaceus]|uniref:Cobyrinate a,c-diamide synthase n=1 Tax=Geobacter argillaceus TaxID=345631 RepID=A0A562VLS7_9BACT|nr:cobyrinate a,c-diamide synthase [Geobacter argillaceus]TWJ18916.1 hydrogenobyrinic acid a,c-diamide synthase (glutamine-hydrolysing) /cobyrinate a,c-diamide synthase [Geobacter argillaceus]